jgi:uncharacterized membrane protein YphA (DoxX/SURF4 family)
MSRIVSSRVISSAVMSGAVMSTIGRIFFTVPLAVFALQFLVTGRWAGGLPPVPPWTHGEHIFSYVTGATLLVISLSLLANKEARLSATIFGLVCMFCVVFLHAKHFSGIIHDGATRTRAFETFALGGAAFVLAMLVSTGSSIQLLSSANPFLAVIGRYVYAFSMIIFGVQHFMYAPYIAFLIPKWMPVHLFLAYATGVAFIAAGLAIATHIFSRLASFLLGLMFFLWVVTLHAPRVFASPHNADELTSLFVALAFSGASFALAAYSSKSR